MAIMSDSSIRLNPVIDEPSKPMPSSNAPGSSSRPIANDFRAPKMSVNQKRTNSTFSSSTRRRTSSAVVLRSSIVAMRVVSAPFVLPAHGRSRQRWLPYPFVESLGSALRPRVEAAHARSTEWRTQRPDLPTAG
jgi:hypothetical protein